MAKRDAECLSGGVGGVTGEVERVPGDGYMGTDGAVADVWPNS